MKIRPYEQNAKKHPKKQIDQIMGSIKEFGMNQQIVVDKDGVIIVGHGRYEALQKLGWEIKDEYIKVVDLTEEQAKAYRLADNKLNESEWDMTLVIEELKGLSEPMLDLTGFDKDLIIEPDEKDDEVPETPTEPRSKLGDLYELSEHRVLCGSSTDSKCVENLMNGINAELLFTSPPYSDMRDYNGGKDLSVGNLSDFIKTYYPFVSFQIVNLGIQRKNGEINEYWNEYINKAREVGYKLLSWNIWNRENAQTIAQQTAFFAIDHEWIFVFGKFYKEINKTVPNKEPGKVHTSGNREKDGSMSLRTHKTGYFKKLGSVITCETAKDNKTGHPAVFSVDLVVKHIEAMTTETDIVVDSFLGSGTTLIASEKTGRICYGMELDPKYVDVIVQRYVDYTGNTKIRCNGEDIEWTVSVK